LGVDELRQLAEQGDPILRSLFRDYSHLLAQFIYDACVLFYPRWIRLSGGFSKMSPFFLEQTQTQLNHLLKNRLTATFSTIPEVQISKLENPGLLGAARLAFQSQNPEQHLL
jgi:predicted NBD/HSP70 family sugar kinase